MNPLEKYQIIVDILGILLASAAIIGSGIWYILNRKVDKKVEKEIEGERSLSRAESNLNAGYVLWFQYRKEKGDESFLEKAIQMTRLALEYVNKLDEKEQEEIICKCKCNLIYYLAEQEKDRREKDKDEYKKNEDDEAIAMKLGREIYQIAKRERNRYLQYYSLEESYAWALWCFAGGDERKKKKAREIITGLKEYEDIPENGILE